MKKDQDFSISKRIKSFNHAFNGFKLLIREEHNSRIHLLAASLAIFLGFFLHISVYEWLALLMIIALVIISEIFNTAIENICDLISLEKNDSIKRSKTFPQLRF